MSFKNLVRAVCATVLSRKPISFHQISCRFIGAYDNDGKTYVTMLNNKNIKDGIMVSGYSQLGFRLNNNLLALGPIICFSNSIMAWYIEDDKDISEDSLSLLFNLEPMPSVVILGIGDNTYRKQIDKVVLAAIKKYGCNIEVLPIDAALATYNFIVSEQRHVAGAFIPPKFIPVIDDDVITASARHVHLYGEDIPKEEIWVDDDEKLQRINKNYQEFGELVGAQKAAKDELQKKFSKEQKDPKQIK